MWPCSTSRQCLDVVLYSILIWSSSTNYFFMWRWRLTARDVKRFWTPVSAKQRAQPCQDLKSDPGRRLTHRCVFIMCKWRCKSIYIYCLGPASTLPSLSFRRVKSWGACLTVKILFEDITFLRWGQRNKICLILFPSIGQAAAVKLKKKSNTKKRKKTPHQRRMEAEAQTLEENPGVLTAAIQMLYEMNTNTIITWPKTAPRCYSRSYTILLGRLPTCRLGSEKVNGGSACSSVCPLSSSARCGRLVQQWRSR